MDSIRKFFANFQKHGTISKSVDNRLKSLTNKASALANEAKYVTQSGSIDLAKKQDVDKVHHEDTEKNLKDITVEITKLNSQDSTKHTNKDLGVKTDTTDCLKVFDEILEEMYKDLTDKYVSLDKIDDVLNLITEENSKALDLQMTERKSYIPFEIPKFDLQDLIQRSFNVENNKYTETIYLDNICQPNAVKTNVNNYLCKTSATSEKTCIEVNKNEQEWEIISLSSEDSQAHETNTKTEDTGTNNLNYYEYRSISEENVQIINMNKHNNIPIDVKVANNIAISEKHRNDNNIEESKTKSGSVFNEPNCDLKHQDRSDKNTIIGSIINNNANDFNAINAVDNCKLDNKEIDEFENVIIENEVIKTKHNVVNDTNDLSIDVVFMDDSNNNCDHKEKELKNIHIEEVTDVFMSEPKHKGDSEGVLIVNEVINNLNDEGVKPQDSSNESDEDCGYRSSDFEFITEDEAKMDGLIINFNINKLKRKIGKKRVKTIEVAIDQNSVKNNVNPSYSESTKQVTELQDIDENITNCSKLGVNTFNNASSLRHIRKSHHKNDLSIQKTLNVGINDIKVYKYEKDSVKPDANRNRNGSKIGRHGYGQGPTIQMDFIGDGEHANCFDDRSGTQDNSGIIKGFVNCSREDHKVLNGAEFYNIFDPNLGPLPHQRLSLMESKSTMSMSTMLVEYSGVGFDMQLIREWSESEEEVKEAKECARKILEMYPGENRKRRRRL